MAVNLKKPMPQSIRTAITALNTVLVVLGLMAIVLLAAGTLGAKSSGTFSLFGRSYHLSQSDQMSPKVEKSDLVVIRNMSPTSFQLGNLIAYYQEEDGKNYLIIRELVGMVGSDYYLEDGAGNQTMVAAETTRFLGRVESRSPKLGLAVQFLQSKEGKSIYLWWTASLLFLLCGVIILLHIILKNIGRQEAEDETDYGVDYLEAETAEPEEKLSPDFPAEELPEPPEEPKKAVREPPKKAPAAEAAAVEAKNVSANGTVPAAAEEKKSTPVSESVEDDFDLNGIISDIQAQLDNEENQ